jgi:EAL domain-containing protein (putative c-di-GMP-specific phosphodiesterase class I)
MPDRFIPLVEETKLIHLLTDWVVEKSLLMLKKMSDQGLDIDISINVSAKNLYDPLFFDRTMAIIKKHKVDISKLEIEITETELMVNPAEAKEVLKQFAKQGLKVALDDFGSGYSSLAYLTQFPLDVIKIDKIFMIDILTRPQIKQIVSATVALSRELGYNVVAEGIEDKETSDYLTSIGCDYAQGYYYAKPMPELDILKFMNQ